MLIALMLRVVALFPDLQIGVQKAPDPVEPKAHSHLSTIRSYTSQTYDGRNRNRKCK